MMSPIFRRSALAALVVAFVLTLVWTSAARAGSGSVVVLPSGVKKVTTGLSVEVDTEWVDGTGFRPVKVRVRPLGGGSRVT